MADPKSYCAASLSCSNLVLLLTLEAPGTLYRMFSGIGIGFFYCLSLASGATVTDTWPYFCKLGQFYFYLYHGNQFLNNEMYRESMFYARGWATSSNTCSSNTFTMTDKRLAARETKYSKLL